MKLYRVVDKKSSCAEYFIASCDEDAVRIWSVMAMSSRPMYEFLDDYVLQVATVLAQTANPDDPMMDGVVLKRMLESRKEQKNEEG